MMWLLGALCVAWTIREIACLIAGARRRVRLLAWVERWDEAELRPGLVSRVDQRPG